MAEPTQGNQDLRERIKVAIQTAQDSEGRMLYVIPPGAAGMYADAVMRVLTLTPYPLDARAWCHPRHSCHHWFEDECSEACDRGEHAHANGAPECADPKPNDSEGANRG